MPICQRSTELGAWAHCPCCVQFVNVDADRAIAASLMQRLVTAADEAHESEIGTGHAQPGHVAKCELCKVIAEAESWLKGETK